MRQFLLAFLLHALAAAPNDQDLIQLAVENKNAELLINEFTYNWTLKLQDVVDNARHSQSFGKRSLPVDREANFNNIEIVKKSDHQRVCIVKEWIASTSLP
uniref:Uncharacterized protein n=1 Tax=Romanomermis culicivorax TaxID=13658 RepID=A0A915K1C5_ROMCU